MLVLLLCVFVVRHSFMLSMSSKSLVLIRNVFPHLIRSSFSCLFQCGFIVFLSSLSIHFSLSCTFLHGVVPSRWYLSPITLHVFMSCPEKYIAESRFPVPDVVALDTPMYNSPGLQSVPTYKDIFYP